MTVGAHSSTAPGSGANSKKRPIGLPVLPDNIPDELKAISHWVVWRYTWKTPKGKAAGKWDKPPTDARTGKAASSTDASTWSTFVEAMTAYATGRYDGIGFVVHKHDELTEDGELRPLIKKDPQTGDTVPVDCACGQADKLVVLDTDKCRDPNSGEMNAWAKDIFAEIDSYAEASPSATGGRGVARGRKPSGRCKKGGFEIYETGRYVTITGHRLPNAPAKIEERQEAIARVHARMFAEEPKQESKKRERAANANGFAGGATHFTDDEVVAILDRAKNGPKFRALMAGDVSGHGDDDSAADAALCSIIAFITKNAAQIERIFGRSKLADRDKWGRPDYRRRTIDFALSKVSEQYEPRGPEIKFTANGRASANGRAHANTNSGRKAEPFTLGPLTLRLGSARRTPAGVVKLPVGVLKDGALVADFVLSSTPSGWKGPAQLLAQLLDDEAPGHAIGKADIEKVFRRLIAEASQRADAPAVVEGPTIESIVREKAPAMWQLKARTDKGVWSETKPGEVFRSEFTCYVPDDLVDECAKAADAPKLANGMPARQDLVRQIQTELLVVWSSLHRTLPAQADANLGENTAAGRQFRTAMVHLWTTPSTWEIPKSADGSPSDRIGATKASLVSRVKSQRQEWQRLGQNIAPRETWRPIHPALSAWWRVAEVDAEIIVFLAMRWDLANAVRQSLPGVIDQRTLQTLGKQFGVLDAAPAVSANLSGRVERLAVLSQSLTTELLAVPDDDASDQNESEEKDSQ